MATSSSYRKPETPVTVIVLEKPWGTHYRVKAYVKESREQFLLITDLTILGKEALRAMNIRFAQAFTRKPVKAEPPTHPTPHLSSPDASTVSCRASSLAVAAPPPPQTPGDLLTVTTHYRVKAYVKESREQFLLITDLTILRKRPFGR